MPIGMLIGETLGFMLGVDANVGGVGIAMLFFNSKDDRWRASVFVNNVSDETNFNGYGERFFVAVADLHGGLGAPGIACVDF